MKDKADNNNVSFNTINSFVLGWKEVFAENSIFKNLKKFNYRNVNYNPFTCRNKNNISKSCNNKLTNAPKLDLNNIINFAEPKDISSK